MNTPEITPRLKKLLLMLSSTQPGEVVAAAGAIGRTLREAGRDWHDLARGLLAEAPHPQPRPRRPPPDPDEDAAWRVMWRFCRERQGVLRSREREFIDSLGEWRGRPTETQRAWLSAIYARLRRS
jgi:hypothetical protein